jgi:WG containing repeat
MKHKILFLLLIIVVKPSIAQNIYKIQSRNVDEEGNVKFIPTIINQNGIELYKPDSNKILKIEFDYQRTSKNGVISFEYFNKKTNKNYVVLIDSIGRVIKELEGRILYYNTESNIFHTVVTNVNNRVSYDYFKTKDNKVSSAVFLNSKGEEIYKIQGGEIGEIEYCGDGFFKYQKDSIFNVVKPNSNLHIFNINNFNNRKPFKVSNGLIPFQFNYKEQNWEIEPNNKFGYLNINNEIVISPIFGYCSEFSCNRAFVSEKEYPNEVFLINNRGQRVTEKTFILSSDKFSDNLMAIQPKDDFPNFRYIDTLGNYMFDQKFKFASQFKFGKAMVSLDGKSYFLIDKFGKTIPNSTVLKMGWWDNNLLYNSFSDEYINLKSSKVIYSNTNFWIKISSEFQLNNFKRLDKVSELSLDQGYYSENKQINLTENLSKLTKLKFVYIYAPQLNLDPIFNLISIKYLEIKSPNNLEGIDKLKNLEKLGINISNMKKLPTNFSNIKKLNLLVLNGKPDDEFINNLFSLNKNLTLKLNNEDLINEDIKIKLSKHFKSILNSSGYKIIFENKKDIYIQQEAEIKKN